MEFFKIKKDIPFMKNALVFNAISLVTFLLAVFFLFSRGLHLSVEFTGGTVMEVSYTQAADVGKVRGIVAGLGFNDVQVQNFGSSRDVMIRLPAQAGVSSAQQSDRVMAALKTDNAQATMRRTEFVGPQVGEELATDGLKALAFVVVGIMLYLAVRFEWKFAVAAVIANLHDVIIILGFFAFFQWEFSLAQRPRRVPRLLQTRTRWRATIALTRRVPAMRRPQRLAFSHVCRRSRRPSCSWRCWARPRE